MSITWVTLAKVKMDNLRLGKVNYIHLNYSKPKQDNIGIDKLNLPSTSAYVIEEPHDFVDVRVQHHKGHIGALSVLDDVVFVLFPLSELLDEHR